MLPKVAEHIPFYNPFPVDVKLTSEMCHYTRNPGWGLSPHSGGIKGGHEEQMECGGLECVTETSDLVGKKEQACVKAKTPS